MCVCVCRCWSCWSWERVPTCVGQLVWQLALHHRDGRRGHTPAVTTAASQRSRGCRAPLHKRSTTPAQLSPATMMQLAYSHTQALRRQHRRHVEGVAHQRRRRPTPAHAGSQQPAAAAAAAPTAVEKLLEAFWEVRARMRAGDTHNSPKHVGSRAASTPPAVGGCCAHRRGACLTQSSGSSWCRWPRASLQVWVPRVSSVGGAHHTGQQPMCV